MGLSNLLKITKETLMKFTFSLITLALLVVSCASPDGTGGHTPKYRATEGFAEVDGMKVLDRQGALLGKIDYVTADLENGRLAEVVVTSRGGLMGMGGRTTSVPPEALAFDEARGVMVLAVTRAKFDSAPPFNRSDAESSSRSDRLAEVIRYYNREPWFAVGGQSTSKGGRSLRLGYVQPTGRILGLPITNNRGEYIGRVKTLIMDLTKGQIAHVVILTRASSSPSSVIQARALQYNASRDGLVLNDSLAELAGEPHFKWLNAGHTEFKQEAYVNQDVKADGGLHSRQNAAEGRVGHSNAMEQGKNSRDEQKTRRIVNAIAADSTLSANAKNIEVATLNSQTTLRGHVNSPEGKRRIGEIAEQAGRPENVSNLLEVRPAR
jgi:sporulation protein YlmC with PRC-barrel domain